MRGMTLVRDVVSESDLFDSYRLDPAVLAIKLAERREKRPCACRGYVEADPIDPAPGVREHQNTREHARWREDNEL
jgi:hypothetical protein